MQEVFLHVGVALGLGLLVGLQRERKDDHLAGLRTFPLIVVSGVLAVELGRRSDEAWVFSTGLLALVAFIVTGNLIRPQASRHHTGVTTEVAAVFMYLVGGLLGAGAVAVAVVAGGLCAVLLHLKQPMEGFATRLSESDVRSVMHIAAIGLVVLPVLPDRSYGPYGVLNPFQIWLMVVLIVGISLGSYVLYRLLGARAGTLLGGVLGGLISSTATTVSHARRARGDATLAAPAALVIMVASSVVYLRIFVEIAAVAPTILAAVAPPLVAVATANLAICALGLLGVRGQRTELPLQEDPTELRAALAFGALYGVVIFGVAAARDHFGDAGLYGVALVSGLTDVDAITLSTANLAEAGRVGSEPAWRAILLASLSNLVFKGAIACALGGRALALRLAPLFGASLAAGAAVLVFWP